MGLGAVGLDAEAVHEAYDKLFGTPFHATLALFLDVVRDLDWTSDIAALRARLVAQTPALMRLFLDSTFGFVVEFRGILADCLEQHPQRRTCSDTLTAAEEASLVVSEALEAAKFALARAAANPERRLPEADEVEAVLFAALWDSGAGGAFLLLQMADGARGKILRFGKLCCRTEAEDVTLIGRNALTRWRNGVPYRAI